jgi:hypothetical protein
MTALYRAGRQAEALQSYQDARRVLVEELGIEPCTELQRLHQAILAADPSLARPGGAQADAGRPPPIPDQLPLDIAAFTGRHRQLERLRALLEPTGQYGPVVISAIDGTAGIGKSALAIYLAHRLDAAFPDGQLYASLHGTTAGLAPLDPLEVLGRFLRALSGDDGPFPADLDAAAGLFRSLVAGRRLLVVLDDAASAEQVRPLLPASPGCGVLITSRRTLGGLDGAVHLHLDVLAFEDTVALVALLARRDRVAAEPEAVARLVELCGRLPLALRIAGARLAARPVWKVETLVRRLDAEHQRLDELAVDDLAVRASFDVSYQSLHTGSDRAQASDAGVFRLLGLLETPDIAVPAAAVLVGQSPQATEGHWSGWWTPNCWKPRVLAATACMTYCDCSPASAAPPRSPRGCAWTRWSGRCAGTSRPPPAPAASCTRPTSGARPATAMPRSAYRLTTEQRRWRGSRPSAATSWPPRARSRPCPW